MGILIPSPPALLRGLNEIICVKDSANLNCYDQWLAILWIQNSALRILFSFWTKQIHLYKPFSAQCSTKGIYRHSMKVERTGQTSHNCQAHWCGPGSKAKKKKKRKKIINKAVELCVIQAEVCASWWEDWSFTFRQTVRKCFKPSMAKRSTSVCYTPNDARAEPRLPKLSEGFCFYCDPLHRPGYYPHYLTTTPLDSMHRQSECILTIISSAGRTSSSAYQQVITMELEISSIRFLSLGSAHLLEGGVVGFFF